MKPILFYLFAFAALAASHYAFPELFATTRCINGYTFVVGADGNARQVLDEFGKGARCNQERH